MFASVIQDGNMDAVSFFVIFAVALVCGAGFACLSCLFSKSSKSFAVATGLLPAAVAVVIVLVNGNLGVGVAIAGAFGLVRFRSAPGTAREIAVIFIAMAAGLAFGIGYLGYGAVFLAVCGVLLLASEAVLARRNRGYLEKTLTVTIPEALDYTTVFDDVFRAYTDSAELEKVKSVNMGSMFRLTYRIRLRSLAEEKTLLDALRVRNGNLEIVSARADLPGGEL